MHNFTLLKKALGNKGWKAQFRMYCRRVSFFMMYLLVSQLGWSQTNDHCSGAEPFPAITTDGTCHSVAGSLQSATVSPMLPCYGYYSNDLWYTFNAPENLEGFIYVLEIDWANSFNADPVIEIYESCNAETVSCFNDLMGDLSDLIPGENYLVRVKNYYAEGYFDFTLCLQNIQPALNDECENATDLGTVAVYGECSPVTIRTFGSTYGGSDNCAWFVPGNDVYYTFTMPEDASELVVDLHYRSGYYYLVTEILDACDGEIIACNDELLFSVEDLEPGTTYLLRFYNEDGEFGSIFDLCLSTKPTEAINATCEGAILLGDLSTTCAAVEVNTFKSNVIIESHCTGNEVRPLWYSFYLPEGVQNISYSMNAFSGSSDLMLELWDECGGEMLYCFDSEEGVISGLESDRTYLVCTYSYNGYYHSIFELCIKFGPEAPVNDQCTNALPIPNIPDDGSCVLVTGTTAGSSNEDNLETCYYTPNNDVWYEFTVPTGYNAIYYSVITENYWDYVGLQLFESCDTPAENDCNFDFNGVFDNLEEGQTYLLRLFSDSYDLYVNYELCLSVFTELVNDDICDAVLLNVNSTCEVETYHNIGATDQEDIDYPYCGYYMGNDVWFKVVVPESGALDIKTTDLGIGDATMTVYQASSCDDVLEEVDCNDDSEDYYDYYMPRLELYDLTPGDTLFIRVYGYNDAIGYFGICVSEPCTYPYDFEMEVTNNSVDIVWSFDEEGAEFNWELRTEGMGGTGDFGLVTSGTTAAGDTIITISDLNHESIYYFFVQTSCFNEWSYPMSFYSGPMPGCMDENACNYNPLAGEDDGSCDYEPTWYYRDADGDGYGDPAEAVLECHAPEGYVADNTDCDDSNANYWTIIDNVIKATLPALVCNNADEFELPIGTPAGTWSGEGVTEGVLDPIQVTPGILTLTYTLSEVSPCWLNESVEVSTTIEVCSGVEEANGHSIAIYPTMATEYITIQGEALTEALILDINGKVIKTVSLQGNNRLNVTDITAGLYFINVKSVHTAITAKFIVVK